MDSTFGQVALPLAVAAGSAVSPYFQRGVGPMLGTLGAIGNWNENKARTAAIQAQADQANQETQGRQQFAQDMGNTIDQSTTLPQAPSGTFGAAMGGNAIEPSPEDVAAGQAATFPKGSPRLSPEEAALYKSEVRVPSMQGTAAAGLQAAANRSRLPTEEEAIANMPKPRPGVTYRQQTQGGGDVVSTDPASLSPVARYAAGLDIPDNIPDDIRQQILSGRAHEVINRMYPADKTQSELKHEAYEDWKQRQPPGKPTDLVTFEAAWSRSQAAGQIAAAAASPRNEAGMDSAADHYAARVATVPEVDPLSGIATGKMTIDPAVYKKAYSDFVSGGRGKNPGDSAEPNPKVTVAKGPPGSPDLVVKNGKWVPVTPQKGAVPSATTRPRPIPAQTNQ